MPSWATMPACWVPRACMMRRTERCDFYFSILVSWLNIFLVKQSSCDRNWVYVMRRTERCVGLLNVGGAPVNTLCAAAGRPLAHGQQPLLGQCWVSIVGILGWYWIPAAATLGACPLLWPRFWLQAADNPAGLWYIGCTDILVCWCVRTTSDAGVAALPASWPTP